MRKHKEKMSKWQSTLAGLHQRELEITRDLVRLPSCSSTSALQSLCTHLKELPVVPGCT